MREILRFTITDANGRTLLTRVPAFTAREAIERAGRVMRWDCAGLSATLEHG